MCLLKITALQGSLRGHMKKDDQWHGLSGLWPLLLTCSPSFILNICGALLKLSEDANILGERQRLYFAKELNNYILPATHLLEL